MLLTTKDRSPVVTINLDSPSPFLLTCDHAGAYIPEKLGTLGLKAEDLEKHIAIDIGIFATTSWIAAHLHAPCIAQNYSRLVIDCNRKPKTATSIAEVSDLVVIPKNKNLSEIEAKQRLEEIFQPYQDKIAQTIIDKTTLLKRPPILVAMHSFTRQLESAKERRSCDIGVIFEEPNPLAHHLYEELSKMTNFKVQKNEPYQINMKEDYTIPYHAILKNIPYVEIEICQDIIATCQGQRHIANLFVSAFKAIENL